MSEPFNIKLIRLRKENSKSQDEIAETLRVTRQTVSNWENNKSAPNYWNLLELKNLYSISWDDFLGSDEELESLLVKSTKDNYAGGIFDPQDILSDGICNLNKEDISSILHGIIEIDYPEIAKTAIELKKRGYKILSIYPNGFSIKINSTDEAKVFLKDITDILDLCFMHAFNFGKIDSSDYDSIKEIYYGGFQKSNYLTSKQIFNLDSTKCYSLYDNNGNSLWLGNTESDCETAAKELNLSRYTILQCDDFEGIDGLV